MTTDTVPKICGREVTIGGVPTRVTGIAKGAAMIGPNMATMLVARDDRRLRCESKMPKPRSSTRWKNRSTASASMAT